MVKARHDGSCGRPRWRRGIPALLGAMLLLGAGGARAHVEFEVDPFGEAQGRKVVDLERVTVLIRGSEHVDVRTIKRQTLRLGTRDLDGASARNRVMRDVDGDGHLDVLVQFKVEATGLREARDLDAVLTGGFRGGRSTFRSVESVVPGSSVPSSYCYDVDVSSNRVGLRCSFTTSLADTTPLDLPALVEALNQRLVDDGTVDKIEDNTTVVVELYGGAGHGGTKEGNCGAGSGGARGYAQTVTTVAALSGLGSAGSGGTVCSSGNCLWVYVGMDGTEGMYGGSSSLLMGQDILDLSDVSDPSDPEDEKVIAIAGGGGGGGKAFRKGETFSNECYHGHNGGRGGYAEATTNGASSAAGQNGSAGNVGHGGNSNGSGAGGTSSGGTGKGNPGTSGIGGFGSNQGNTALAAGWSGSSVTQSQWPKGRGGNGGGVNQQDDAGGGGGGFGGGGGGQSNDNNGGGGGGGSWARQATVASGGVENLILGEAYDAAAPTVYLTFQLE